MSFSTKRDANFIPAIFGVSSLDLKTPTQIKVNPATGAMFIDSTSLSTGVYTPATKVVAPVGYAHYADYYTDGVADDVEINAAITAASNSGGGDVLIINTGNIYNIAASINTAPNVNIRAFEGTTLKAIDNSNIDVITLNGGTNITIEGLNIDGNKANQTTGGTGIRLLGNASNIRLRNIYISNAAKDGFKVFQSSNFKMINCIAYQCGKSGLVGQGNGGFNLSTANNFILQNCTADGCDFEGINPFNCYDFEIQNCKGINSVTEHGIHPNTCYNFSIIGGEYNNNGTDGIKAIDCYKYHVLGATVANNINMGINCSSNGGPAYEIAITGNTSYGNVRGIYCSNGGGSGTEYNVTIAGNTVVGNSSWGIGLSNAHDCTISGNVSKNNLYGIILSGTVSLNNVISGNRCYDDQVIQTQQYGFSDNDFSTVTGNDFSGNINNGVLTPGANSNYSSNKGYHSWVDGRRKTTNVAGNSLIVKAEGATDLATDKAGGDFNIEAGVSTGTASSAIRFWNYQPGLLTSTNDQTLVNSMTLNMTAAGSVFMVPQNASSGVGTFTSFGAMGAANGTNLNGGSLGLQGGRSTGSGTSTIDFRTASANTGSASALSSISLNNLGSGYAVSDLLTISGGGGTGGTATVNTVAAAGAIQTLATNIAGTGYVAGDVLTISGGGGNATLTVSTIDISGGIQSYVLSSGTGYSTATAVSLTGGTGTGAKVDISAVFAIGAIRTITLTAAGTGYSTTTGAATTGGIGTGATLNLTPFNNAINSPTTKMFLTGAGNLGIGTTTPTGVLHLKAGTATANTAPVKLTLGVNLTTPEPGVHEYNGNHYVTNAAIRVPLGGTLFDHYTDGVNTHTDGTTFDDLYTDTLAVNTFNANGDKATARFSGIFVSSATATREIKVLFAGTTILDTGALTTATAESWDITVMLIRVSSTVVRCVATIIASTTAGVSAFNDTTYTEVTSLTLSNTNILKITGVSGGTGAAASDIVAKLGSVAFAPAA